MNVVRGLRNLWEDPAYKACKWLLHFVEQEQIPDKLFLKYQYHYVFGEKLNLKHPKKFNEKLQWLKLYDRNPLYTTLVDKYAVKGWVAERIGEDYIIPTLAVYDCAEQINLDDLPNQFVLKCTHDSGSVVICKNKESFDLKAAQRILNNSLKTDFYKKHREWPYKNVPHRIIAEEYMKDIVTDELRDYKFFCMDGVCKALFIATERMKNVEPYFDFYDTDFNHLDIIQGHPNSPSIINKPESFELMKGLASRLSRGIPNVRCDFYEVNGRVYFGEMTLFHFGGIVPFYPEEIDIEWGNWITLPHKR
jgi:hypothetical protein